MDYKLKTMKKLKFLFLLMFTLLLIFTAYFCDKSMVNWEIYSGVSCICSLIFFFNIK